jgi:hypothetical protein
VCTGERKCITNKHHGIIYNSEWTIQPSSIKIWRSFRPEDKGKEQTGEEFVPEDDSPDEEEDSPEEFEKPTYSNQREQLKHIRELITDVEHHTQLATEEQDVVERTNNEHTAHNFEQYNLLLEWLDGRADLLERLLTNTELYYTSIRKWAAARTNKDERRKEKYYIQRGEHKQHVEVLQRNIDEHQGRIPSVTLLPEEQPVTEGTESSERPTTPTRRRTWSIPGGYIQSPQYQRTRGVDPADNETGESPCKTVGYVKVRHRFRRYSSDETCLA